MSDPTENRTTVATADLTGNPPRASVSHQIGHNDTWMSIALKREAEINRLRGLLRRLAEAVLEDVRSCDSVVSIDTENQARVVIEEILA